jgi:uncharacterized membrane protein YGL010W
MTQPDRAPSPLRRAAAAAALVALVVALLYLAISAIFRWYILLTSVISLGVLVVAVWFTLSRRGLARATAGVVAVVALVTFIGVVIRYQARSPRSQSTPLTAPEMRGGAMICWLPRADRRGD